MYYPPEWREIFGQVRDQVHDGSLGEDIGTLLALARSHTLPIVTDSGMVPDELDYRDTTSTIRLTMSALHQLSNDVVIVQHLHAEPRFLQAVRALTTSMAVAGARVREATLELDQSVDYFSEYTHEEFWQFNLAIDIVAMFRNIPGIDPAIRAQATRNLQALDQYAGWGWWKRRVRKAGDGSVQFRELRSYVPARKPRRLPELGA